MSNIFTLLIVIALVFAGVTVYNDASSPVREVNRVVADVYADAKDFVTDFLADLGADDENQEENPLTYGDYSVKIVDGLGNPVSQVVVKYISNDGATTKTRLTGADGVASLSNVPLGNYQVILEKGLSTAGFETWEYELTADSRELEIIVRDEAITTDIYGEFNSFAYSVGVGSYTVPTDDNYSIYVVFHATKTGIYRFTLDSADADATIGYYGMPLYVQATHRGEGDYDGRSFEIIVQDTATPYVIGVNIVNSADTSFSIERVADAPFDPYHAPWTIVPAKAELSKCDLPEDVVLTDLDITDKNLSVTLGEDGYYYTNDGELVYIRLGSISTKKYLDVSIAYIAGFVDSNFGQNFGGYVYDDNGDFVGKYSYNDMIGSYYEICDSKGVCPLTAELAEAIICHGNSSGWWNPDAMNFLFSDVDYVVENAWLFLCCTAN